MIVQRMAKINGKTVPNNFLRKMEVEKEKGEREREKRKTRERRFFNFAGGDIAEAGDILQRDEFGGRVGGTGRERGQIASTRGHAYGSDQKSKHQEEVLHPGVRLGGERGRL